MASPANLISLDVVPVIGLLKVGEFSGWFYPGAIYLIMAGIVRFPYFNAYGSDNDGAYAGLP